MAGMNASKPHPSDVKDEEWKFVAPCLTLLPLDAGQREHSLREVFNALRRMVKSVHRGACCRMISRRDIRCISKHSAASGPVASRPWPLCT
jgi:hypothetical protein